MISVCIDQPTQDVQLYQGKDWHRHEGSEGPWSQYGTCTGTTEFKEHYKHYDSQNILQHPSSQKAPFLYKIIAGDNIHNLWSVLCPSLKNILPGEMVWWNHTIVWKRHGV